CLRATWPAPTAALHSRSASSILPACGLLGCRSASTAPASRARAAGEDIPSVQLRENVRYTLGSHRLHETFVDHYRSCKAACTKALRFNDRKPAVRRRGAELPAAGFLQERTYHVLRTANVAGRRGAHLDEVFANRMLVVHGVEGDHALHVCGRDLEQLGNFRHGLLAHPAAVFLHHP